MFLKFCTTTQVWINFFLHNLVHIFSRISIFSQQPSQMCNLHPAVFRIFHPSFCSIRCFLSFLQYSVFHLSPLQYSMFSILLPCSIRCSLSFLQYSVILRICISVLTNISIVLPPLPHSTLRDSSVPQGEWAMAFLLLFCTRCPYSTPMDHANSHTRWTYLSSQLRRQTFLVTYHPVHGIYCTHIPAIVTKPFQVRYSTILSSIAKSSNTFRAVTQIQFNTLHASVVDV